MNYKTVRLEIKRLVLKKEKLLPNVQKLTGKVVKVGNKLGINKEKTKR